MWIDTHCHLDAPELHAHLPAARQLARARGVQRCVIPAVQVSHFGAAIALACLAGLGVLYLVGMPYIAVILNGYMGKGLAASKLFMMAMIPYLPGDCLKIVVTALLG